MTSIPHSSTHMIYSALVLLLAAPLLEAFVVGLNMRVSTDNCSQGGCWHLHGRAARHRALSAPRMAVSPAAAEDIANKDDVPPLKDAVSVTDFESLDVRVGRIVLAEPVPDPDHENKPSRKYISLVVDLGNEKRRVVSAVRSIVDVDDAIGKSVLIAANVEEETVLGLPSRGRLLSASNFSKEPMPRTLRTVLLGGGGVPPGSAVTGL